eukprot:scaffold375_cov378-Prasinococcus_capsulatus_cf.AAC.31
MRHYQHSARLYVPVRIAPASTGRVLFYASKESAHVVVNRATNRDREVAASTSTCHTCAFDSFIASTITCPPSARQSGGCLWLAGAREEARGLHCAGGSAAAGSSGEVLRRRQWFRSPLTGVLPGPTRQPISEAGAAIRAVHWPMGRAHAAAGFHHSQSAARGQNPGEARAPRPPWKLRSAAPRSARARHGTHLAPRSARPFGARGAENRPFRGLRDRLARGFWSLRAGGGVGHAATPRAHAQVRAHFTSLRFASLRFASLRLRSSSSTCSSRGLARPSTYSSRAAPRRDAACRDAARRRLVAGADLPAQPRDSGAAPRARRPPRQVLLLRACGSLQPQPQPDLPAAPPRSPPSPQRAAAHQRGACFNGRRGAAAAKCILESTDTAERRPLRRLARRASDHPAIVFRSGPPRGMPRGRRRPRAPAPRRRGTYGRAAPVDRPSVRPHRRDARWVCRGGLGSRCARAHVPVRHVRPPQVQAVQRAMPGS